MTFDIIASLLLGALAGMGIGGGGLLVIYLTLVKDFDQINAQAINLLFFIFAAASSLAVHAKKRKMDIRLISIFAVSGIVGSLVGTGITALIPSELTRKLFGAMLMISGAVTLIRISTADIKKRRKQKIRQK